MPRCWGGRGASCLGKARDPLGAIGEAESWVMYLASGDCGAADVHVVGVDGRVLGHGREHIQPYIVAGGDRFVKSKQGRRRKCPYVPVTPYEYAPYADATGHCAFAAGFVVVVAAAPRRPDSVHQSWRQTSTCSCEPVCDDPL